MNPNIILMIAHDLGRHLGCYGVETAHTPHLDRLAAQGVRLSNEFCVAPQCSPSRAALFTGRYPHQNGVMGLTHSHFAWDLSPGERHLAQLLQNTGYRTALAGGQHETRRPQEMGYSEFVNGDKPAGAFQPALQTAELCADFLASRRGRETPFYLQVGFFEPHRAPGVGDEFGAMPPDASRGVSVPPFLRDDAGAQREFAAFQGAIRSLDEAVGRILSALDDNQRENTIVLFTTDHGIPFPRAKCSLYDAGLETAFLIRWPRGGWSGGRVVDELASHVDVLPTLLEACGVEAPGNLEGRSFAPGLRGENYTARGEIYGEMTYHEYPDPVRCVRTRTHKLIANFSNAPSFMDPSQSWRPNTITTVPTNPSVAYHPPIELYDLTRDPLEQSNRADDPECAAVRDELLAHLGAWMRDTSDPLLHGIPPAPIHRRVVELLSGSELG